MNGGDFSMRVTAMWEARFGITNEQRGLDVTRKIWHDMQQLADCLDHEIVLDRDEPGHIVVISHWTGAEIAEAIKNRYAAHPNVVILDSLVIEPRRHFIGVPHIIADGKEQAA
jgi:hypothetical protein